MQRFDSDTQLLIDLKHGQPEAVKVWFKKYSRPLHQLLVQKITNTQDLEELVQDTFISCLKHLPLFRGESSIWTWMCRVSQHEVADYYRRKYAKRVIKTLPVTEVGELMTIESSYEISQKVKAVLQKMSHSSRELLQRKYIDKQKMKVLAVDLDRSVKAVESALFRARAEFRQLYTLENT